MFSNFIGHLSTVIRHKNMVLKHCIKAGIVWRGLTHDLSKFSPTEFIPSVKYYQGTRSPNERERELFGYSSAWMHHKGRNRHHYEYWTDMNPKTQRYESVEMPRKYLVEMVMDRRAACMTYQGAAYTNASPLEYLEKSRERNIMHPETRRQLQFILEKLKDEGETETFRYLKEEILGGKPFPWEE